MSFEGLIALGVLWVVLNLFAKFREKVAEAEKPDHSEEPPGGGARPRLPDATQQEGFSLERVLREIQRAKAEAEARNKPLSSADTARLKTAWKKPRTAPASPRGQAEAGPLGRHGRMTLPSAEEVEERGSLEGTERVVSAETEVRRPEREVVDQDDAAEQLVQRRITDAEARNRPLDAADHRAFDRQVRQQPAAKTVIAGFSVKDLRNAVVWREILGPPVGLS